MLRPPNPAREMILLWGADGSGKTFTYCNLAAWLRKTGSPAKVFVVNTDKPLDMYAYSWDGFYDNIVELSPHRSGIVAEWGEYQAALDRAKAEIDPARDDWYVIDVGNSVWEQAKATFITEVKGEGVGEFYLQAAAFENKVRLEAAQLGLVGDPLKRFLQEKGVAGPVIGGSYGKDWDVINKVYREFMLPMYRLGAHVLILCHEKKYDEKRSHAPEMAQMYERMGVEPAGQKGIAAAVHSQLRLQRAGVDKWVINTIRETSGPGRNRKYLSNQVLDMDGHFVTNYLIPVAGWRL